MRRPSAARQREPWGHRISRGTAPLWRPSAARQNTTKVWRRGDTCRNGAEVTRGTKRMVKRWRTWPKWRKDDPRNQKNTETEPKRAKAEPEMSKRSRTWFKWRKGDPRGTKEGPKRRQKDAEDANNYQNGPTKALKYSQKTTKLQTKMGIRNGTRKWYQNWSKMDAKVNRKEAKMATENDGKKDTRKRKKYWEITPNVT